MQEKSKIVLYNWFKFYEMNKEDDIAISDHDARKLITHFYSINNDVKFDTMKKNFVKRYITNESELEQVHDSFERKGLKEMYSYIHEEDIKLDIYTILDLHEKLYSFAPYKEVGGHFRNSDAYLSAIGKGNELAEWSTINYKILEMKRYVSDLIDRGKNLRNTNDYTNLFRYIEECVLLKCDLIKLHPFFDGNGRVMRGFLNILFELANIPPVYVKSSEKLKYHEAMNERNVNGNPSKIINFYYNKICDSILELELSNMKKDRDEERKLVIKEKNDEEKTLTIKLINNQKNHIL